jgi:hypothetical protein
MGKKDYSRLLPKETVSRKQFELNSASKKDSRNFQGKAEIEEEYWRMIGHLFVKQLHSKENDS